MMKRNLQADLERIRSLSNEEIAQIQADLVAGISTDTDQRQDEWQVYRGATTVVPQAITGEAARAAKIYRGADVYEYKGAIDKPEYKYIGTMVSSANDNDFRDAA